VTVTSEVFSIEIRRRGNHKVGGSMYRYSEVYPIFLLWCANFGGGAIVRIVVIYN
jgi:hypothetical protein